MQVLRHPSTSPSPLTLPSPRGERARVRGEDRDEGMKQPEVLHAE
ncbi:MAG: hypothetical protein OJF50_006244 [Nitrospira sp.]|nr:hypothetical protein [Nitrospira sp.]